MALSGTLTGTCDNTNYTLTCEWTATQNATNKTSTITAKVYLKAPSGWSTISDYWCCTINGTQVTTNKSATVSGTKVLLGQKTWTVSHASDGTCSTTISFSYTNGLTSIGTYTTKKGSGSKSITLDKIATASTFTLSSSSLTMGSSQTVKITKLSSSYTHTVTYTFGSSTTTVASKTTSTSVSFTPPTSLASQIPNATSGTCTVKVTTYNGDTSIGTTSKTFTLKVPSSSSSVTVKISTTYNSTVNGLLIAGKSTVKITPIATTTNGATIKSYSYSGAGLSGTGSSKTTGTLSAGTYTVTVTATDSRGATGKASVSFTVYSASAPTMSFSVNRATSSYAPNDNGTYALIYLTWNVSNPNNANTNAKQFKVEKKTTSSSSWSTAVGWTNLPSYTGNKYVIGIGSGYATTTSYNIRVSVKDSSSTVQSTKTLSTVSTVFNIEQAGVGIGKIHEKGKLDVSGDIYSTGEFRCSDSPSYYSRIGYALATSTEPACTYISNGANNWLRLRDDGTLTWKGQKVLSTNGNLTLTGGVICGQAVDTYYCTSYQRYNPTVGNIMTKIGVSTAHSEPAMAIEIGTCNSAGGSYSYQTRYRFTTSYFSTHENNKVYLGSSSLKFKAVYATNGTIQTSDERYKYILEDIEDKKCYDLIKEANLYGYSTLNKRIDEYNSINEVSEELQKSSYEDATLHMGIIAQEVESNELSKYILIKDEVSDGDYIYGIDNYAYTTAVHGALKYEIKLREMENLELRREIEDLKQEIKSLKK